MDGLEDKLSAILSNPDAMGKIAEMARSLGMSPPEDGGTDTEAEEGLVRRAIGLLRTRSLSSDENALLDALRPFLSVERQRRMDRAIKIARLASLASLAGEFAAFGGDDAV